MRAVLLTFTTLALVGPSTALACSGACPTGEMGTAAAALLAAGGAWIAGKFGLFG